MFWKVSFTGISCGKLRRALIFENFYWQIFSGSYACVLGTISTWQISHVNLSKDQIKTSVGPWIIFCNVKLKVFACIKLCRALTCETFLWNYVSFWFGALFTRPTRLYAAPSQVRILKCQFAIPFPCTKQPYLWFSKVSSVPNLLKSQLANPFSCRKQPQFFDHLNFSQCWLYWFLRTTISSLLNLCLCVCVSTAQLCWCARCQLHVRVRLYDACVWKQNETIQQTFEKSYEHTRRTASSMRTRSKFSKVSISCNKWLQCWLLINLISLHLQNSTRGVSRVARGHHKNSQKR